MGIEFLIKHFYPANEELGEKTPGYVSIPITALKVAGAADAAISTVLYFNPPNDESPTRFLITGAISLGVYLLGVAADYIALQRADNTQEKES